MHIDEFIKTRKIEASKEALKLKQLLNENHGFYTLFHLISEHFMQMPMSDNMTALQELIDYDFYNINDVLELAFIFETVDSLLLQLLPFLCYHTEFDYENLIVTVHKYMINTLNKLGMEFHEIEDENLGKLSRVVRKDIIVDEAVETAKDLDLRELVFSYNNVTLSGNIKEKKAILRNIIHAIEPIYKSESFKERYGNLSKDLRDLANNYDLRHNNQTGKDENKSLKKIPIEQQESLYDAVYRLCLQIIILDDYLPVAETIKEIKNKYKIV